MLEYYGGSYENNIKRDQVQKEMCSLLSLISLCLAGVNSRSNFSRGVHDRKPLLRRVAF